VAEEETLITDERSEHLGVELDLGDLSQILVIRLSPCQHSEEDFVHDVDVLQIVERISVAIEGWHNVLVWHEEELVGEDLVFDFLAVLESLGEVARACGKWQEGTFLHFTKKSLPVAHIVFTEWCWMGREWLKLASSVPREEVECHLVVEVDHEEQILSL